METAVENEKVFPNNFTTGNLTSHSVTKRKLFAAEHDDNNNYCFATSTAFSLSLDYPIYTFVVDQRIKSRFRELVEIMDKSEECRRYKWSALATNLLVSIWCHDLVQNQLKLSSRNQPIWESIARYMTRKGFPVTGLQCRTRIKNMLCSYHEAVRKNDPTIAEPYYDIFKNIMGSKVLKKSALKAAKINPRRISEEVSDDKELNLKSESCDIVNTNSEHKMEFLDSGNEESGVSGTMCESEKLKNLENVIVKAIDSQTKAITNAIKVQSETIEKLVLAERQKWESIVESERESRKQLEKRLDTLLSKLEKNFLPQITYMGTLIVPSQNQ